MEIFGIIVGAMVFGVLVFIVGVGFGQAVERDKQKDQKEEAELHDEMTLHKVYRAFMDNGIPQQKAIDTVNSIMNVGILFREHKRPEEKDPTNPLYITGGW